MGWSGSVPGRWTKTPSDGPDHGAGASSISERRAQRAADDALVGRTLCRVWTDDVDEWLAGLVAAALADSADGSGIALVAVGGYGRGELSFQSDIDVVLVHAGRRAVERGIDREIGQVADRIWYPIWDAGMKLGHAVRTVDEALALAADDLDTATALLDIRPIGGDAALADELAAKVLRLWRKRSRRFLTTMAERVRRRHASAGEVAYLLEPDLKVGHGGLRDVQALRWAQAARSILWEGDPIRLDTAYDQLLEVRVELHRRTGRPGDKLLLQEQDAVAAALGYDDADDLVRQLAHAARTIAWTSDDAWARIESSLSGPLGRLRRERTIDAGLVLRDGEVHVTADADVATDPVLPLRAAAAAAAHDTRVHRASLARLAAARPPLPDPWPDQVRAAFVELLLAGPPAVPMLEALDQHGIWERYVPEWPAVRAKPQRNAYHRFTVDRHLWETAVQAASLAGQVARPELLVLGALFHDIGKGRGGDHTDNGVTLLATIGPRMGLPVDEAAVLVALCRHHLLLPDVATRRDLDDPATVAAVAGAVGSAEVLGLLAALTEADGHATGPAAWSAWKADLVRSLVTRVDHVLGGGRSHDVVEPFPTTGQRVLLAGGEQRIVAEGSQLTVICTDRHGLFNRVAGVLALHGLDVLDAAAATEGTMALEVFRVESSLGPAFAWPVVVEDLQRALDGRLALRARLAERARRYASGKRLAAARVEAEVRFDLDAAGEATVVEVHAPDAVGVLYRITRAFADLDLDIVSAKVQTLGPMVVDSFYLRDAAGRKITDRATLAEVERAVLHALEEA
ncbi:MAG: [protein-PII] uridylyltransferase [Acidimicrobiales bacterium]